MCSLKEQSNINKENRQIKFSHKKKNYRRRLQGYGFDTYQTIKKDVKQIKLREVILIAIGACILTFGVTNVHQRTDITEGGVLGIIVLLYHNFGVPAAISAPILDIICYTLAFRFLGIKFLIMSGISSAFVTAFYALWELTGPILPNLSDTPLLAALVGCIFVGIGVGLIVTQGGSSGGDDAIVIIITNLTKWKISRAYMLTDTIVLLLSLSYIPVTKIAYSLLSTTLSSIIIGYVQNLLTVIYKTNEE